MRIGISGRALLDAGNDVDRCGVELLARNVGRVVVDVSESYEVTVGTAWAVPNPPMKTTWSLRECTNRAPDCSVRSHQVHWIEE